ncbi:MAG: transcription termination factor NusA [Nitrospinota bacterium]|nr:transcription termination factor NusA [Nitrospinota bacterium]MDH5755073.1 transcription termination factor NusA [Nitrospinota bacterium]
MTSELINALKMVADEKAIKIEDLIHIIEEAVTAAAAKRLGKQNLAASFNTDRGEFDLFELLEIKEEATDSNVEISLEEALDYNPSSMLGEMFRRQIQMEGLGRIAAQSVRQMIHKKGKELELDRIYAQLKNREGEVTSGKMVKRAGDGYLFEIDVADAILPKEEQLDLDRIERGKRIKLLIIGAERGKKEPIAIVSRNRPPLLRRLLTIESPEVADGQVEIVDIVRDRTGRSKVAVRSRKQGVDPVGSCVGVRGGRIQPIVQELSGEKIDVFEYSDDPAVLIKRALTPARDLMVIPIAGIRKACVVAPESQLSPAIGKKGVNIQMAQRITGWGLDVLSHSQYEERKERLGFHEKVEGAEPDEKKSDPGPDKEGEESLS